MKRIGLLGGMSWESSIAYERMLNEGVRAALGGTASADLVIRSYNFAEIESFQERGDWGAVGDLLASDAAMLAAAGCDLVALCTNTMHRVAAPIEAASADGGATFVHLADATADEAIAQGLGTVGLLGTRYTMEQPFYRERLEARGLTVIVPLEPDLSTVHDVIYHELVRGIVTPTSRSIYQGIAERLVLRGADGIIAGCTEIELLLTSDDVDVPYLPTTALHVKRLLALSLADEL